jgi:hypothetical protein
VHVNPTLSAAETDALLEILERGIVLIRLAAMGGDAQRAEAIADALHNVPRLIREGQEWGWTVAVFRDLFLTPLTKRYPDLAVLRQSLDETE